MEGKTPPAHIAKGQWAQVSASIMISVSWSGMQQQHADFYTVYVIKGRLPLQVNSFSLLLIPEEDVWHFAIDRNADGSRVHLMIQRYEYMPSGTAQAAQAMA